jgi:hypothetical protein
VHCACAPPAGQVVAASNGALLSVFDGTTEYRLGKWTLAKHGAASWPPLEACFYAYITPSEVSCVSLQQEFRAAATPAADKGLCPATTCVSQEADTGHVAWHALARACQPVALRPHACMGTQQA